MKEKLGRTDKLAIERTLLSNERTMLAHIRTALAAFILAIAILKLFGDFRYSFFLGVLTFVFGLLLIIISIIYYYIRKKKISRF